MNKTVILCCLFMPSCLQSLIQMPPDYSYEGICRLVHLWKNPRYDCKISPEVIWPTCYFVLGKKRAERNEMWDLRFALENMAHLCRYEAPLIPFYPSRVYLEYTIEIDGTRYNLVDLIIVEVMRLQMLSQRCENDAKRARLAGNKEDAQRYENAAKSYSPTIDMYLEHAQSIVERGIPPLQESYDRDECEIALKVFDCISAVWHGKDREFRDNIVDVVDHDITIEYHGMRLSLRDLCEYAFLLIIEDINKHMLSTLRSRIAGDYKLSDLSYRSAINNECLLESLRRTIAWWENQPGS